MQAKVKDSLGSFLCAGAESYKTPIRLLNGLYGSWGPYRALIALVYGFNKMDLNNNKKGSKNG